MIETCTTKKKLLKVTPQHRKFTGKLSEVLFLTLSGLEMVSKNILNLPEFSGRK